MTMCRSVYAAERAPNLGASAECWVLSPYHSRMSSFMTSLYAWLFTGLDDVLGRVQRMEQSSPSANPRVIETTDTSGDETNASEPRMRVGSKRTYKLKKVWAAKELSRFFWTGLTDVTGKPIGFYCFVCPKNVSVLNHVLHEPSRPASLTGESGRARTGLRRELHDRYGDWTAAEVDFEGSTKGQGQRLVFLWWCDLGKLRDSRCQPPIARKSIHYELVHQLWSQFTLVSGQVNVDLTCSRDDILVSVCFDRCFT